MKSACVVVALLAFVSLAVACKLARTVLTECGPEAFGFSSGDGSPLVQLGGVTNDILSGTVSASGSGNLNLQSGQVSLDGHGFTNVCTGPSCADSCAPSNPSCLPDTYGIELAGGGSACIRFGFPGLSLQGIGDGATSDTLVALPSSHLRVDINDNEQQYDSGAVATADNGNTLKALVLISSSGQGVFFSACGPFIIQDGVSPPARKRVLTLTDLALGSAKFAPTSVSSDPHLKGLFGIEFDVYGKPAANYNLLSSPAFQINTQLAAVGPEMRFMSQVAILFRNTSVTIGSWTMKTRRAELVAHFESLGAKVAVSDWQLHVWPCDGHEIVVKSMHTYAKYNGSAINYLDVEVSVPGCHDAYGGLLGQTYQCKYATEKFDWSRDKEETFRLPVINTPSGTYTGESADCMHEDDYRGSPVSGATKSDGAVLKMSLGTR